MPKAGGGANENEYKGGNRFSIRGMSGDGESEQTLGEVEVTLSHRAVTDLTACREEISSGIAYGPSNIKTVCGSGPGTRKS